MAEIRKIRVDGTDYDVRDTSKVPVNQGTANAGKIVQVGADGNLVPTAALDGKVDKTQTVNGKALNANITLDANDIPYDDDPEAERIVGSVGSAMFQRPKYNQVVRVDSEQSLADAQKEIARGNIGAASADDLDALDIDQRLLMEYIKGTRQSTTWDSDERAETLHKDYQTGVVIRADRVTFNYSDTEGDGIMETRTLYEGGTRIVAILEIFTNLSTLEDRITYYKP